MNNPKEIVDSIVRQWTDWANEEAIAAWNKRAK